LLTKTRSGIRFNEHIEGDGPTVFAHAYKMGLEGIVSKEGLGLPFGTLAGLAQDEESECSGGDAGGRSGSGQKEMAMTEAGKNRIMIFGPKADGTYVIESRRPRARRWPSRSREPRRQ
jgi:hypothetical protein